MSRRFLLVFLLLLTVVAGLIFYALQLRNRVAEEEQRSAQPQVIAPPGNGPAQPVTLYLASDEDGLLHRQQVSASLPPDPGERARTVLRALISSYQANGSAHRLSSGADVRDVYLLGDDTAVVDMNAAFADAHPSGVLTEELTISSIMVTLKTNVSKLERVKILVDGKERETLAGHADLHRFYHASDFSQMNKDMQ